MAITGRPYIIELSFSNETLRKSPYINSRLLDSLAIGVNLNLKKYFLFLSIACENHTRSHPLTFA